MKLISVRDLDNFFIPFFQDFIISLTLGLVLQAEEAWTFEDMKRLTFCWFAFKVDQHFDRLNRKLA